MDLLLINYIQAQFNVIKKYILIQPPVEPQEQHIVSCIKFHKKKLLKGLEKV